MKEKELETTTVELVAGTYGLRASATKTVFDGFSRVYTEGQDDSAEEAERALPALAEGDVTRVADVTPIQHFTEPPPRYTEATLIKALEEHGIGRPSTYAATISTIVDRGYVKVVDRRLHPEPVGEVVTDLLVEHFGKYVDLAFTAGMEEELDEIARGERPWVPLLREFYGPLKELVDEKRAVLRRRDFTTEPSDEVCSLGHPMVIRLGRNGRFLACSLYPEHKESRPLPGEEEAGPILPGVGEACPKCGPTDGGVLAAKRGRFGPFVGCSRYPDCDYIKKDGPPPPEPLPFEVACPKCGEGRLTPAPRPSDRLSLLGLLALSEMRLHDLARAARRHPRRRCGPGCPEGRRGGDVPPVRLDDGPAGGLDRAGRNVLGRSARSRRAGPAESRRARGAWRIRRIAIRRSSGRPPRRSFARPADELRAAAAGPSARPRGDRRRRPRAVHRRADRP